MQYVRLLARPWTQLHKHSFNGSAPVCFHTALCFCSFKSTNINHHHQRAVASGMKRKERNMDDNSNSFKLFKAKNINKSGPENFKVLSEYTALKQLGFLPWTFLMSGFAERRPTRKIKFKQLWRAWVEMFTCNGLNSGKEMKLRWSDHTSFLMGQIEYSVS